MDIARTQKPNSVKTDPSLVSIVYTYDILAENLVDVGFWKKLQISF